MDLVHRKTMGFFNHKRPRPGWVLARPEGNDDLVWSNLGPPSLLCDGKAPLEQLHGHAEVL